MKELTFAQLLRLARICRAGGIDAAFRRACLSYVILGARYYYIPDGSLS